MFFNKLFKKNKFTIMSVILALLVICLVVVVICFYTDKSENNDSDPDVNNQLSQGEADAALSGDSCFLVVCNDDGSSDILYMFLAEFRIYSSSIIITPLSPETVALDGRSYDDGYSYGGINMLKNSVETVRNIVIDRYAILDRDGMSELTDLMGEVELYVDEDFTYQSSDKSYEVGIGENEMGSDMLFTYLSLYSERHGSKKTAELLCEIVNTYLSVVDKDEAQKLFLSLTNCFSTDVTISDYYSAKNDIEYLIDHNVKCELANDVDS